MSLRKRSPSLKIRKAAQRLEAMKIIDDKHGKIINYGGEQYPLTKNEMTIKINECRGLIEEYNSLLETADKKSAGISRAEEELGDFFTRVLAGGKSIFGVDSDEVAWLGGTKKSERKRKNEYNKNILINLK